MKYTIKNNDPWLCYYFLLLEPEREEKMVSNVCKKKKIFCNMCFFWVFLVEFIKGSYATSWNVSPGDSEYFSLEWPLDGRHPHLSAQTTGSPHGGLWTCLSEVGLKLSPGVVSHHWNNFFFLKSHELIFILWISSKGSQNDKPDKIPHLRTNIKILNLKLNKISAEHLTSLDIFECLCCQFWSLSA